MPSENSVDEEVVETATGFRVEDGYFSCNPYNLKGEVFVDDVHRGKIAFFIAAESGDFDASAMATLSADQAREVARTLDRAADMADSSESTDPVRAGYDAEARDEAVNRDLRTMAQNVLGLLTLLAMVWGLLEIGMEQAALGVALAGVYFGTRVVAYA